jgi:protein subunit release factor A
VIDQQKLGHTIIPKEELQIIGIGLTLYDLQNIVNGDIQKIIDELKIVQNNELLKNSEEVF